jgi:hypothetical protein
MASNLREALLKRARQWAVFHDWERNQGVAPLELDQRIAWYAAAFDLSRNLPSSAPKDIDEKVVAVHKLHSRLKHLPSRISHV